jgi:hypothetical protein
MKADRIPYENGYERFTHEQDREAKSKEAGR